MRHIPEPDEVTRRFEDGDVDLLSLLDLERVEEDLFRNTCVFLERPALFGDRMSSLYGGQVAAQALLAAGRTVAGDRQPHSLHGYFLRAGDSRRPTVFQVARDRDGNSFSARRVVAVQNGKVIFSMAASFQAPDPTPLDQVATMPDVEAPEQLDEVDMYRLASVECRAGTQPYEGRAFWLTRFWGRATQRLPDDPLVHAAVLTYLSDISTGVLTSPDGDTLPSASLDHAVWFHETVDMNEWVLADHQPQVTGHGRGWYNGSFFTPDGRLVASIAQETLFR